MNDLFCCTDEIMLRMYKKCSCDMFQTCVAMFCLVSRSGLVTPAFQMFTSTSSHCGEIHVRENFSQCCRKTTLKLGHGPVISHLSNAAAAPLHLEN